MTPEEKQELARITDRIRELTQARVLMVVIPSEWPDRVAVRFSYAVSAAMRAGVMGLLAIERAVREIRA